MALDCVAGDHVDGGFVGFPVYGIHTGGCDYCCRFFDGIVKGFSHFTCDALVVLSLS